MFAIHVCRLKINVPCLYCPKNRNREITSFKDLLIQDVRHRSKKNLLYKKSTNPTQNLFQKNFNFYPLQTFKKEEVHYMYSRQNKKSFSALSRIYHFKKIHYCSTIKVTQLNLRTNDQNRTITAAT